MNIARQYFRLNKYVFLIKFLQRCTKLKIVHKGHPQPDATPVSGHALVQTHPMHGLVDGLQRLQALGHEEVGELELDVVHPRRVLQDPLLVRVRGVVVGHGAGGEKAHFVMDMN